MTLASRSRPKAEANNKALGDFELLSSAYRVAREKGLEDTLTAGLLHRWAEGGVDGFLRAHRAMSPEARNLVFSGRNAALGESLDRLARVGGYLERYAKTVRGGSGGDLTKMVTTPNIITGLLAWAHTPTAIGAVVVGEVGARLLASPRFAQWLQRVPREAARGTQSPEWQRHIARLRGYAVEQLGLPWQMWGEVVEALSPTPARAMFGGEGSKTADAEARRGAEAALADGASPRDVWRQYGWHKGSDGKWRNEIDDSKATMRRDFRGAGDSGVIGDLLDHPDLFSAYPEIAKIKFKTVRMRDGSEAAFDDDTREIEISDRMPKGRSEALTRAVLHEIQHWLQQEEGFEYGGGNYWRRRGEMEAFATEERRGLSAERRRAHSAQADIDERSARPRVSRAP